MDLESVMASAATLFLSMFCLWAVLFPFLRAAGPEDPEDSGVPAGSRDPVRERLLSALEDLERDWRGGKLAHGEYETLRREMFAQVSRMVKS